jgi:hypothetical protein
VHVGSLQATAERRGGHLHACKRGRLNGFVTSIAVAGTASLHACACILLPGFANVLVASTAMFVVRDGSALTKLYVHRLSMTLTDRLPK